MSQRSWFVRPLPLRPQRWLGPPARRPRFGARLQPLALAPQRFAVGALDPAWLSGHESADSVPLPRPWPKAPASAPVNLAFYYGRVSSATTEDGQVSATLWERPSGRSLLASLPWDRTFRPDPPKPGDLLLIWTWVELPGGGAIHERLFIQVVERPVSAAERAEVARILEMLP